MGKTNKMVGRIKAAKNGGETTFTVATPNIL